jgi:hypothetical protein
LKEIQVGSITSKPVPPVRNPFEDAYTFQDEVLGAISLSEIERDLVDTPEFQRLFRTSQLGFVDFIYPCANHTRGIHSIGCCYWSKRLVRMLNENRKKIVSHNAVPEISTCEAYLIGIAALLHDISHGPYAHDIEKKSHEISPRGNKLKVKSAYGPYEKHDDYVNNPALYITLLNCSKSNVARVLQRHSQLFWNKLQSERSQYPHLRHFISLVETSKWDTNQLLPNLLFHLFAFEKIPEAMAKHSIDIATSFEEQSVTRWGLGPKEQWKALHEAWYQPYRHDIIGDTLSADLLDYLHRDARRLNIGKTVDPKLLNSYVLVYWSGDGIAPTLRSQPDTQGDLFDKPAPKYRCAVDLNDYKRGSVRTERLNDLFRLLDLRYEIHEKAVFHRVTQAAIAMCSRALLLLPQKARPTLQSMYGFDGVTSPALCGEDHFLELLIEADKRHGSIDSDPKHNQGLPAKLAERRVYRPLMVISGDRVRLLLSKLGDLPGPTESFEPVLRELAAIIDSEYFKPFFCFISSCIENVLEHSIDIDDLNSYVHRQAEKSITQLCIPIPPKRVIYWVTPYKQLHKDPAILVCLDKQVTTIDCLSGLPQTPESVRRRVIDGMADTESKYSSMWKMYVFLSDGLFYSGTLSKLLNGECARDANKHSAHLEFAQEMVIRSLRCAWTYWIEGDREFSLSSSIDIEGLTTLLNSFASNEHGAKMDALRNEVATIPVSNYLHGWDAKGAPLGCCRDVRYKYSDSLFVDYETAVRDCNLSEDTHRLVIQAFKASRIDPRSLTQEECMEIVGRMSASPKRLKDCIMTKAAREEGTLDKEVIQDIWRAPEK